MTIIGGAWLKFRGENSTEPYYSLSFDKAIIPLTLTPEKRLILKENKNKGNNEKAPDFWVDIYIPEQKAVNKE